MDELNREVTNIGIVKISDEVVSVIASIAAGEITGIVETNSSVAGGITQILTGKKASGKGAYRRNSASESRSGEREVPGRDPWPPLACLPDRPARFQNPDHDRRLVGRHS